MESDAASFTDVGKYDLPSVGEKPGQEGEIHHGVRKSPIS